MLSLLPEAELPSAYRFPVSLEKALTIFHRRNTDTNINRIDTVPKTYSAKNQKAEG